MYQGFYGTKKMIFPEIIVVKLKKWLLALAFSRILDQKCQFNEIFDGQYFRAQGEKMVVDVKAADQLLDGIANGFAALIETHFHDLNEQPFITRHGLTIISCTANNPRFHLWWWVKNMFINSKTILNVIKCLKQYAQYSILLRAWWFGYTFGYFLLKHTHDFRNLVSVV